MIKKYRELKNLTQEQMSIYLGITLRHYQNIEKYNSIPSVLIGYKISLILETDIYLLWSKYL